MTCEFRLPPHIYTQVSTGSQHNPTEFPAFQIFYLLHLIRTASHQHSPWNAMFLPTPTFLFYLVLFFLPKSKSPKPGSSICPTPKTHLGGTTWVLFWYMCYYVTSYVKWYYTSVAQRTSTHLLSSGCHSLRRIAKEQLLTLKFKTGFWNLEINGILEVKCFDLWDTGFLRRKGLVGS